MEVKVRVTVNTQLQNNISMDDLHPILQEDSKVQNSSFHSKENSIER